MWQPNLYKTQHNFVFEYGKNLITLLDPQAQERILDLGCGTGELTAAIAATGCEVVGIDASKEMIASAKENYPDLDFRVGRGEEFMDERPYDAIFSNATLHWILNPEAAINAMYTNLKPGGRLVLEMGGKGNVGHIVSALRNALTENGYPEQTRIINWYFPSLGTYCHFLEKRGFAVSYAEHYDRPTKLDDIENGIYDWLTMFAGRYFEGVPDRDAHSIKKKVQQHLKSVLFKNGHFYADYKRLRVVAVK